MDQNFDIRHESTSPTEKDFENALRPLRFADFTGQQKVVENLEVFATPCCTALPVWARPR